MSHAISDFVWRDGTLLAGDAAVRAAAMTPAAVVGQFAAHLEDPPGTHVLARDPLGVNKLFFAIDAGGKVAASNSVFELRRQGQPLARIGSVPSGHRLELEPARRRLALARYQPNPFEGEATTDPGALAREIGTSLFRTFDLLRAGAAGRPLFVTMSGGLDSTAIAVLAREHLGRFTGVTFTSGDTGPGSDLDSAGRLAELLGVQLLVVEVPRERLAEKLDLALVHGQDWRDFNVHCALVNAWLAEAIAAHARGKGKPLVLTGDVMNEMMADYAAVEYRGKRYYELPRLPPGRLRRFLVGGLDSGDREVGIFAASGIDTIQPYAMCAEAYARVPGEMLATPGFKQALVQRVLGNRIPPFIYQRPKVRAQVGSSAEVGGTLAAMIDQGIDSDRLARRFAELLQVDLRELVNFVRGGYYRFPTAYPE